MAGETIVLIEDDRDISAALSGMLQGAGYRVFTANNGIDGQKLIANEDPAIVVTDMMMPKMGGFPVLDFISSLENKPKVIMMTANEGGRHKAYAEMMGVVEYHRKPFPPEVLLDSVRRALGEAPLTTEDLEESDPPPPQRVKPDRTVKESDNSKADETSESTGPLGPLRRSRKKT